MYMYFLVIPTESLSLRVWSQLATAGKNGCVHNGCNTCMYVK